jgi:hypothetical protein
MRPALTKLLFTRHPGLFALRDLHPAECALAAWGFEHEDGWFGLTAALAEVIAAHTPEARVWQWKRKFTSLRVSLEDSDAFCTGAIAAADAIAGRISERSGRPGRPMVQRAPVTQVLAPQEAAGWLPVSDSHTWLSGAWSEQRLRELHPHRLDGAVITWSDASLFIADAWLASLPQATQMERLDFAGQSRLCPQAEANTAEQGALALLTALTPRINARSGSMGPVRDTGHLAG